MRRARHCTGPWKHHSNTGGQMETTSPRLQKYSIAADPRSAVIAWYGRALLYCSILLLLC